MKFKMIVAAALFIAGCGSQGAIKPPHDAATATELAAQPGEGHLKLSPFVGQWDVTSRSWVSPEARPNEIRGVSNVQWAFGGRFLREEVSSATVSGPFRGLGLFGYDNAAKRYESTWVDSKSTAMNKTSGVVDSTGRLFDLRGNQVDPMTGRVKAVRALIKVLDNNRRTVEVVELLPNGREFKSLEMTYVRRLM